MKRLSVRIFIAFWSVIVLTLVSVVLINSHIHRYQQGEEFGEERTALIERRLITPARAALDRGGREGLKNWLISARSRSRTLDIEVVEQHGESLSGGRLPRHSMPLIQAWQAGNLEQATPPGRRWARVLRAENEAYLLIVSRPPRPFLFRLFGPFGAAGLLVVAILISGLISFMLARYIARPLQDMRNAGSALAAGDLEARLSPQLVRRSDEIGALAGDFNRMAERLTTMINSQRQLLRDVSHELRSPLARIQVALSLAERDREPRYLERIRSESNRLDALVGEILAYTRLRHADALEVSEFDLVDCVSDIVAGARLEGRTRRIGVELDTPDHLLMHGDLQAMQRAIENVVRNAVRHSPDNATVLVALVRDAEQIQLTVQDCGPGVAEDELERIFEPFARLSPERSETGIGGGIGLAIAAAAVERHQGRIFATNAKAGGLVVTLQWRI
ncbi:MAG: ATP-binding protein [Pseudomonadota bacterium]